MVPAHLPYHQRIHHGTPDTPSVLCSGGPQVGLLPWPWPQASVGQARGCQLEIVGTLCCLFPGSASSWFFHLLGRCLWPLVLGLVASLVSSPFSGLGM